MAIPYPYRTAQAALLPPIPVYDTGILGNMWISNQSSIHPRMAVFLDVTIRGLYPRFNSFPSPMAAPSSGGIPMVHR